MLSEKIDTKFFLECTNKPTSWFIKLPLELSWKFLISKMPHSYESEMNIFVKPKQLNTDAGQVLIQF